MRDTRLQHTLADWRDSDAVQADDMAAPILTTIGLQRDRIDVALPDGRHVWLELEGEALRVHAYDPAHDEPVNLEIRAASITVELQDRNGCGSMVLA